MTIDLKGKQVEAFRDALLSGFPGWTDLDELVEFEFDKGLQAIAGPGNTEAVALEVVRWARKHGALDALLAAALRRRPNNPELRRFAYEVVLTSDAGPAPQLEAIALPSVPFENAAAWRARMAAAERCVCRIEVHHKGAWLGIASGALIGSDVVLTNAHVVIDIGPLPARAQFDYAIDAGGAETAGPAIDLVAAPVAQDVDLDVAVLRLAQPVAAGGARGWLAPVRHRFATGEPLLILQHPGADRLKICVGSVTRATPQRVSYTTNTARGSSGSPCFTMAWQLVALHSTGDTGGNSGIPAGAILDALAALSPGALPS
jgi:hypothetical protein